MRLDVQSGARSASRHYLKTPFIGGAPTTPDRNTSAKVSRYKLVVYIVLSANGRAYFCKSTAIEMGVVS